MALPQLNGPISPLEFYPDKVTVNYQFSVHLSHRDLDNGFRANGFRLSGREWKYDINVTGQSGYGRRGIPIRVGRPRFAAPLNCFVDINPLRIIHEHLGGGPFEYSYAPGSNNWLPSNTISADCRDVWAVCDAYIDATRNAISDIISEIQLQAGASHLPAPRPMHTSVHSAECAIDLYAFNPRQAVVDFMPAFAALLKDCEQFYYRAPMVVRPTANLMVHGFVNTATRVKVYCRTNRRVRFETRFRPDTFKHYGIPRELSAGGQNFGMFFGRCAQEALRLFTALRGRTSRSLNINAAYTPIDLIVALTSATRRPSLLREVLDCVLRTGAIPNTLFDDKFIRSLKERGLLEPSLVHGVSTISATYGYAAAMLANAQEDYFNRKLRLPFGKLIHAKSNGRRNRRGSIYRRGC